MPETVTPGSDQGSSTTVAAPPIPTTPPARRSLLDQYQDTVDRLYGAVQSIVGGEKGTPAEAQDALSNQEPQLTDQSQVQQTVLGQTPSTPIPAPPTTPATPATPTWDEALRDPEFARRFQSEADRRAAALTKSQQDQMRAKFLEEQVEETRIKERQATEEEYRGLVKQLADMDPESYNPELARKAKDLAERLNLQDLEVRWQRRWETDQLPTLRTTVAEDAKGEFAELIASQYSEGYGAIVAAGIDPRLVAQLHHDHYGHAGQWVATIWQTAWEQGQARIKADLEADYAKRAELRAKELADSMVSHQLAGARTIQAQVAPIDVTPVATGGAGGSFRTVEEVETAHIQGELRHLSSGQIRVLKSHLPHAGEF